MARRTKIAKADASPSDGEGGRKRDLLSRIRRRYPLMVSADHENRVQALADLRFLHVAGEQWEGQMKRRRGNSRPRYEFNKLAVSVKRVVNELRSNRPQVKVRAVEDGDKDTADVLEGLIRNVWNMSDADSVTDYAADYQVGCGMGAWRVETGYADDDSFDQDILIRQIKNPLTLYADPSASDMMKRDARDWILPYDISKASFEERWPKANRANFDDSEFDVQRWDGDTQENVRICEYWYKVPATKKLARLTDGRVIDITDGTPQLDPTVSIERTREVDGHKIKMCIASGDAVLEEADWAGSIFPFIQIYGQWIVVDGKVFWYGMTRNAKDAQRSYNVTRTAVIETIALAPQSKYWATPKQAEGHLEKWSIAHDENLPVQLYNPDPQAGGPPQRMGAADVPMALIQSLNIASDEIKSVTGIYDASLGNAGQESSGVAIRARQSQGDLSTFNFSDNLAKGIHLTGEILIDLFPKIYPNERSMRILGADGAEKYVKINSVHIDPQTLQAKPLNDLSRGKFDVAVTVGPSFTSQRQEFVETAQQLAQTVPQIWQVAGDLIMKAMDVPYAEQMAERMRVLLPPPIQQMLQQGKPVPPEVQAALAQAQQQMQAVQQHAQVVAQSIQQAQAQEADANKAKTDVQIALASLKTEKAQFEAFVAQQLLKLNTVSMQQEGLKFDQAHAQAIEGVQQAAQAFQSQAQGALAQILQEQQRLSTGVDQTIAALMSGAPQSPQPPVQ